MQGVFDPLTANVGASRLTTTEFGCGLTLTIGIVAALLRYRFPLDSRSASDLEAG